MKKNTLFVITSMTPVHFDVPRKCFTYDLESSDISSKWMSFCTWDEAKAWADENEIEISGTNHCIIRDDFKPEITH